MKFGHSFPIIFIVIILSNKIGLEAKKLEKSFDEIFGDGWWHMKKIGEADQRVVVSDCDGFGQQNPNISPPTEQMRHVNQQNPQCDDGHENDANNGNDQQQKGSETVIRCREIKEKIRQKGKNKYSPAAEGWSKIDYLGANRKNISEWIRQFGIGKQKTYDYSDQQKRKIVIRFREIKEKIKHNGVKYSAEEWSKMECVIARKLATHRFNIYEWIREFGIGMRNSADYSDQQKREIVIKFREIKEKIKQKAGKYSINEWSRIECVIARKLGANRKNIYEWIKELGIRKRKKYSNDDYSDQQKRKIVIRFREIKSEIKQKGRKYLPKELSKIDRLVANKLGTSNRRICEWIKALSMGRRSDTKKYSKKQKYEIVKKFIAMTNKFKQKRKHSHKEWQQKYAKIAKKLGLSYGTIKKWKKAFGMSREQKQLYG